MRGLYFGRADGVEPAVKFLIGVGEAVGELDSILLEDEVVVERESSIVFVFSPFHFEIVGKVLNLVSAAFPIFIFDQGFGEGFHRVFEERIFFVLSWAKST